MLWPKPPINPIPLLETSDISFRKALPKDSTAIARSRGSVRSIDQVHHAPHKSLSNYSGTLLANVYRLYQADTSMKKEGGHTFYWVWHRFAWASDWPVEKTSKHYDVCDVFLFSQAHNLERQWQWTKTAILLNSVKLALGNIQIKSTVNQKVRGDCQLLRKPQLWKINEHYGTDAPAAATFLSRILAFKVYVYVQAICSKSAISLPDSRNHNFQQHQLLVKPPLLQR